MGFSIRRSDNTEQSQDAPQAAVQEPIKPVRINHLETAYSKFREQGLLPTLWETALVVRDLDVRVTRLEDRASLLAELEP